MRDIITIIINGYRCSIIIVITIIIIIGLINIIIVIVVIIIIVNKRLWINVISFWQVNRITVNRMIE